MSRPFWRSREERDDGPPFEEAVGREFPDDASAWDDPVTRRQFLSLMGGSLALAGLSGCGRAPRQQIVPYVRQPEGVTQGRPLFFATAMTVGGYATGLLVESHMGRPTKIEGNPDHPASLGATDAFAQASILTLYDPARSRSVRHLGRPSTWVSAVEVLQKLRRDLAGGKGEGIHILTGSVTSPTLARQLATLFGEGSRVRWHQYEPAGRDNARAGARLVFDADRHAVYSFDEADVVVALDGDFLSCGPGHLRYTHDFTTARRRAVALNAAKMSRLYVVEATPTPTGLYADHRLPLQAHRVQAFAAALSAELAGRLRGQAGADAVRLLSQRGGAGLPEAAAKWAAAVARDLAREGRPGRTLILVGDQQPPAVHALVHAMNRSLGNVNKTVRYTRPVEERSEDQGESLRELVEAMRGKKVKALIVLESNPDYDAPVDLDFRAAMQNVPLRMHLGLYEDETSRWCQWHVPAAHYLETWGDARAFDGTVTIQQPLIAPLYEPARSPLELLAALTGDPERSAHDLVRDTWRERAGDVDFEQFWRTTLHDGLVKGTAFAAEDGSFKGDWTGRLEKALGEGGPPGEGLEIVFRPDPTVLDGRFAENAWLQELPKPLTKLTWDNVALMSEKTARELGVEVSEGSIGGKAVADRVELKVPGIADTVKAPAWIAPGHADDSITVFLGYGREVGKDRAATGYNAYALRTSKAPWFRTGLEATRTGQRAPLACTQLHQVLGRHHRNLVRWIGARTFDENKTWDAEEAGHDPAHHHAEQHAPLPLTLYPPHPYDGYKWGMVVDMTACVGCSACVVACQAENNIPVVGKEQVMRGREMHWLRIDTYYMSEGADNGPGSPRAFYQPLPCMQCENAPCEVVCPVEATVHSDDGLNDMVYNRCVGTRYCSNNCPYKVRRFNFLQYADWSTESLKLLRNPDVTVRSRGVMEKCTYCVQRIRGAEIEAEKRTVAAKERLRAEGGDPDDKTVLARIASENRIRDGEVMTACQAACPAGAILFGDLNDKKSAVAKQHASRLNYGLLTELNTRPRTTYLAAVKNLNDDPDLKTG